jgi:hypothetical protein
MIAMKVCRRSLEVHLSVILLLLAFASRAFGQTTQSPPQTSSATGQPVSLTHLCSHFLIYQYQLDTQATAQGQDASWLRSYLQGTLGFSSADYAQISTSSGRYFGELQALNVQEAAIMASGKSPRKSAQLKVVATQRNADIRAEISYLEQSLSPDRITALESFVTQLFAPTNGTVQVLAPNGAAATSVVQP